MCSNEVPNLIFCVEIIDNRYKIAFKTKYVVLFEKHDAIIIEIEVFMFRFCIFGFDLGLGLQLGSGSDMGSGLDILGLGSGLF